MRQPVLLLHERTNAPSSYDGSKIQEWLQSGTGYAHTTFVACCQWLTPLQNYHCQCQACRVSVGPFGVA